MGTPPLITVNLEQNYPTLPVASYGKSKVLPGTSLACSLVKPALQRSLQLCIITAAISRSVISTVSTPLLLRMSQVKLLAVPPFASPSVRRENYNSKPLFLTSWGTVISHGTTVVEFVVRRAACCSDCSWVPPIQLLNATISLVWWLSHCRLRQCSNGLNTCHLF